MHPRGGFRLVVPFNDDIGTLLSYLLHPEYVLGVISMLRLNLRGGRIGLISEFCVMRLGETVVRIKSGFHRLIPFRSQLERVRLWTLTMEYNYHDTSMSYARGSWSQPKLVCRLLLDIS